LTHYNPALASPVRAQRERGLETQSNVIVLVVEDEPVLRMMAVDLVEEAGFKAIEAGKADHAVRILEARSNVRIVFTDIDIPGSMDGMKLAAAVRNRWPPIEIILTSGYYDVKKGKLPVRSVFFCKPYNTSEVIETLQRMAA
jgi:DNA-binding NtrC family response regulator